jgi:MFS transporter, PAT family, beta-lactamase induction signal transducer AmpG
MRPRATCALGSAGGGAAADSGVAMAKATDETRRMPPVWLMGAGYLPLAVFGSVMLITTPQLLAAIHTPEPQIASVTAIALTPGFLSIPLSPILDWRLSRRTYAIGLAVIGALCAFAALMSLHHIVWLTALLFAGNMAISLCCNAVGGWFGNLTRTEDKAALGAWFTVANIGGGGLAVAGSIFLVRHLPHGIGEAVVGLLVLIALPLFILTPCPPADRRLASEGFRDFARDVLALLRKPEVWWILTLFMLPSASFALTNTLGGFGRDFAISEQMVGLIGGAGVAVAGVFGSLTVPMLARRIRPVNLYLWIGGGGALFTLALTLAQHSPLTFGVAMLGENVFQAAAFSAANLIALRAVGHDNPLAATQFGLLIGASIVPLSYMQMIDGNAYALGGVNGSFLADALLSGLVCLLLGLVIWRRRPAVAAI